MTECCTASVGHHCWCPLVKSGKLQTDDSVTDEALEGMERAAEYHELKEMLFKTDPELCAHVAKQLDIPYSHDAEHGPQFGEKMRQGLEHAWKLATDFGMHGDVEREAGKRAARRASFILQQRHHYE